MLMKKFRLHFLCADQIEYDDLCVSVFVPLYDGYVGILSDHANMRAIMSGGELRIDTGEEIIEYAVTEGLLRVTGKDVYILAYSAEKPDEIDENRAEQAAERARMRLMRKQSELEYRQAQASLARAMNRLKVKHKI